MPVSVSVPVRTAFRVTLCATASSPESLASYRSEQAGCLCYLADAALAPPATPELLQLLTPEFNL